MQNSIRILLVDDHILVLDGLKARLELESHLDIVGTANNGEQALEQAHRLKPDVVIMDVSMPILTGLEATKRFQIELPDTRILMLSMHDDREYILSLIHSGASGYVLKDVSSNELIKAIETVHSGNTYFSAGASDALFRNAPAVEPNVLTQELSQREITVLKLLAAGLSNKEIAKDLHISVRTVETHRLKLKTKLGIQSTAGLTKFALKHQLI